MTDPMHISVVMAEYLAELEAACAGNNPGRSPILNLGATTQATTSITKCFQQAQNHS